MFLGLRYASAQAITSQAFSLTGGGGMSLTRLRPAGEIDFPAREQFRE